MQIESLEASAFYKVCTSKYRTSILQKCSTRNDESDENDGRWIMCVPQSRSLGRRITRDDVGTLKRRFFLILYSSISLLIIGLFVCIGLKSTLSLSQYFYLSSIFHWRRIIRDDVDTLKRRFFLFKKQISILRLLDLIVCRSMNTSIYLSIRSISMSLIW